MTDTGGKETALGYVVEGVTAGNGFVVTAVSTRDVMTMHDICCERKGLNHPSTPHKLHVP